MREGTSPGSGHHRLETRNELVHEAPQLDWPEWLRDEAVGAQPARLRRRGRVSLGGDDRDRQIGLFENRTADRPASWKLAAIDGGTVALGARLEWRDGFGSRSFAIATVRGYQSAGDATVTAAAADAAPASIDVVWTDGTRERFEWPAPDADGVRRLVRGDGKLEATP